MPDQIRRAVGRAVERRAVRASTYDAEAHTVELVAATDAPVLVPGWQIGIEGNYYEILDMSPGTVNLSQVAAGNCPLLADHNRWSLEDRLGAIVEGRLEPGQLVVVAEFGRSDAAQNVEAEMASTTPPPCSAGYRLDELLFEGFHEDGLPIYRATKWTLREVSFVPIAADPNAGVRAENDGSHPCIIIEENRTMPPENETAVPPAGNANPAEGEGARAAPVAPAQAVIVQARGLTAAELLTAQASARAVGVELETAELTRSAVDPVADVNALILQRAAERQAGNVLPAGAGARAGEEGAAQRTAIESVLVARISGQRAPDAAGELRGYRIAELIGLRMGLRTRDPHEILQRAMHTTSDFPLLLEAAANRSLLLSYQAAMPTYRTWAAKRSFNDFKPHKFLRIGEFPDLLPVGESGEVKAGTIAESRETVSASTKGRRIDLSRQMIVNDDLGAFGDLVVAGGRAAARSENRAAYVLLAANGAMSDTVAMFHATHGNLAGAGTAITIAAVAAGRAAMRKQKNLGASEVLNLTPQILLVGPDKETEAQQFVSPFNSQQVANNNPFTGKLDVVADAEIPGNVWRLFANPADAPNFIYGYVGNAEGPMITQDRPFGVDGMSMQLLHDFGVGAVDFRGGYQNPGA